MVSLPSPIVAVAGIVGFLSGIHAATAAPIPAGPGVRTHAEIARARTALEQRRMIEAYAATGRRNPRWDQTATSLLNLAILHRVGGFAAPDDEALASAAAAAVEAGCNDPLVLYWQGFTLRTQRRYDEAASSLLQAWYLLEKHEYDVAYRVAAGRDLAMALHALKQEEEAAEQWEALVDLVMEMIADPTYGPTRQRLLLEDLTSYIEHAPMDHVQQLLDAVSTNRPVLRWMTLMITGRLEIRRAWQARTGKLYEEVTEEGWEGFRRHLTRARKALAAAWELDPTVPEAATDMISVTMGESTDRFRKEEKEGEPREQRTWFERAVAAQFDYRPAYEKYLWAIHPRWGGTHEQMYELGNECLQTGRFDTGVPGFLYHAVRSVVRDTGGDRRWYEREEVYGDLKTMVHGYLDQPDAADRHAWYRSLGLALAWRAKRWDDGRQLLDAFDAPIDAALFTRVEGVPEIALGEIQVRTGKAADEIDSADVLAELGHHDAAQAIYEKHLRTLADDDPQARFLAIRRDAMVFQHEFAKGGWIDVQPDEAFTEWEVMSGTWKVKEGNTLVGHSSKWALHMRMKHRLGSRYELRGRIRFRRSPHRKINCRISFKTKVGHYLGGLVLMRYQNVAMLDVNGDEDPVARVRLGETATFQVRFRDGVVRALVNGKVTHEDVIVVRGVDEEEVELGIGGYFWYEGAILEFTNLQIRSVR